jgi:hypothetical protein
MTIDRKIQRRHLIYYLRVFEQDTDRQLGSLVDITPEGIMLVSDKPVELGRTYSLRMELPTEVYNEGTMLFDAVCVWSKNDVNPEFYDSGFKLVGVGPEQELCIKHLMRIYSFMD